MKTHTTIGASILEGAEKRADGPGTQHRADPPRELGRDRATPPGCRGEQIPLAGRICSICDVFDALLSPRPYKDAWELEDVLTELASLRGTKFDPELLDAFLELAPSLHAENFAPSAAPRIVAGDQAGRRARRRLVVESPAATRMPPTTISATAAPAPSLPLFCAGLDLGQAGSQLPDDPAQHGVDGLVAHPRPFVRRAARRWPCGPWCTSSWSAWRPRPSCTCSRGR